MHQIMLELFQRLICNVKGHWCDFLDFSEFSIRTLDTVEVECQQ